MEQEELQRIQEDNAAYAAMSPMERRVRISEEIISMILKGTFVPLRGYGRVSKNNIPVGEDAFPLGDLQMVVRQEGFQCMGCAKAAIIVAKAYIGNEVHVTPEDIAGQKSWGSRGLAAEPLANRVSEEVFGAECAMVIEGLYERVLFRFDSHGVLIPSGGYVSQKVERLMGKDMEKIMAFNAYCGELPIHSTAERMSAIYRNIIDNQGSLVVGPYRF